MPHQTWPDDRMEPYNLQSHAHRPARNDSNSGEMPHRFDKASNQTYMRQPRTGTPWVKYCETRTDHATALLTDADQMTLQSAIKNACGLLKC
jgi:hypothetical protein